MKRTIICIIVALAATLVVGTMTGCSSQDKTIAELKEAISNVPEFESVTVTETTKATFLGDTEDAETDGASAESDSMGSKTVYQFDESGDELKTSMTSEIEDIKIQYFSDGDDAVCVTDGPVYSGTTEQFDMVHFDGFDGFFNDEIGDLNTIVDCIDTVSKEQQGDVTVYTLTLDPEKYIQSDEILTMMAEYGDPVTEAVYTISFDKDGRIVSVDAFVAYQQSTAEWVLTLSDFDSTVIDPMPKADKTYEEMEEDIDAKYDAFDEELKSADGLEDETDSSEVAEAR